ncbi:immunity 51 family protein [Hymenobacter tibetensis]|uniref:Immunity 51 family protein n=1 Tax=Hymenobacter tibetensis TaxID=497967 RepID=A0ABY4D3B0_9BACT|nr:immunity 51 family protein [Hymenobacter tibetensis]UOG76512.1 immunity 51 family protein [Hymenobacter tibetensis]
MSSINFKETISPFFWSESDNSASVCLTVGDYRNELFKTRAKEGFEGSGYDWASLAKVFLEEKQPELAGVVKFDPEGSMYCAYSSDKEALKQFAIAFKTAVEDEVLIHDLFSRAELD